MPATKRITGMPPPTALKPRFSGLVASVKVWGAPVSQSVVAPLPRSITVPSDVANRPPSEENASAEAMVSTPEAAGAAKLRWSVPSCALQSATSPISAESVASVAPSGEKATASIAPSGDPSCASSVQVSVARSRKVPAPVRAASRSPAGDNTTCQPVSGPSVWQRT